MTEIFNKNDKEKEINLDGKNLFIKRLQNRNETMYLKLVNVGAVKFQVSDFNEILVYIHSSNGDLVCFFDENKKVKRVLIEQINEDDNEEEIAYRYDADR